MVGACPVFKLHHPADRGAWCRLATRHHARRLCDAAMNESFRSCSTAGDASGKKAETTTANLLFWVPARAAEGQRTATIKFIYTILTLLVVLHYFGFSDLLNEGLQPGRFQNYPRRLLPRLCHETNAEL